MIIEKDLQNYIHNFHNSWFDDNLILIKREYIVPKVGRLDFLFKDKNEYLYALEVQMGSADGNHISRLFSYADSIEKEKHQTVNKILMCFSIADHYIKLCSILNITVLIINFLGDKKGEGFLFFELNPILNNIVFLKRKQVFVPFPKYDRITINNSSILKNFAENWNLTDNFVFLSKRQKFIIFLITNGFGDYINCFDVNKNYLENINTILNSTFFIKKMKDHLKKTYHLDKSFEEFMFKSESKGSLLSDIKMNGGKEWDLDQLLEKGIVTNLPFFSQKRYAFSENIDEKRDYIISDNFLKIYFKYFYENKRKIKRLDCSDFFLNFIAMFIDEIILNIKHLKSNFILNKGKKKPHGLLDIDRDWHYLIETNDGFTLLEIRFDEKINLKRLSKKVRIKAHQVSHIYDVPLSKVKTVLIYCQDNDLEENIFFTEIINFIKFL